MRVVHIRHMYLIRSFTIYEHVIQKRKNYVHNNVVTIFSRTSVQLCIGSGPDGSLQSSQVGQAGAQGLRQQGQVRLQGDGVSML